MTLEVTKVNSTISGVGELDKKISQATAGLLPSYKTHLNSIAAINATNAGVICDYIDALQIEIKPSVHYRRDIVSLLTILAKKAGSVNFKDWTRQDIISFLQSFEKTEEADPFHKWKGTYNVFREHLFRFFKWLYIPMKVWVIRKCIKR